MSKHTPGPWHLLPSNRLCVESKRGNVALCNLARESYADAALIAAAPELLAVLERYVNAYPAFRIKPEGAPGSVVRIEQERLMALESAALAVILKATGEV